MVVGALADERLGPRLESLSLSRDELTRLLLCNYTREQLHLMVALMSPLPYWAQNGVLLQDDLMHHVLAHVPLTSAAAAAVCSSWRRMWGRERDWFDEISKVPLPRDLRMQEYAKMLRETEIFLLSKHREELQPSYDDFDRIAAIQPQHYVKAFGSITMHEAVDLGLRGNDFTWMSWTAYKSSSFGEPSMDLASNIEHDSDGRPVGLRKQRVVVPGRVVNLAGRQVRTPDVIKDAGLAASLLSYLPLGHRRKQSQE